MEDEEGELFDNTYLDELKGERFGRESLTVDEIQRRNSMVPPHLRSSYMPQYPADEPKVHHKLTLFLLAQSTFNSNVFCFLLLYFFRAMKMSSH